jgi:hypothetical protein
LIGLNTKVKEISVKLLVTRLDCLMQEIVFVNEIDHLLSEMRLLICWAVGLPEQLLEHLGIGVIDYEIGDLVFHFLDKAVKVVERVVVHEGGLHQLHKAFIL